MVYCSALHTVKCSLEQLKPQNLFNNNNDNNKKVFKGALMSVYVYMYMYIVVVLVNYRANMKPTQTVS